MRLVTWNLDGLDDRYVDERTEAACLALCLRPIPLDAVLLQEVTRRTYYAHLRPHLSAAGFVLIPQQPPDAEYFCVIAVQPSLRPTAAWYRAFADSSMGRGLLGVQTETVTLLTAHLESLKGGGDARLAQAALVMQALADGPAVFGGDTNLRQAEADQLDVRDAWELAGRPAAHRFTWHVARNHDRKGTAKARFDRVWLSPHFDVQGFSLIGEVEVRPGVHPSDHLGIEVSLATRNTS